MRLATAADHPALCALLRRHEATSMFPLINLLGQGVPMRVWVACAADGMMGLTDEGMVLPQWPKGNWAMAAKVVKGATVKGLIGPAEQVGPLRVALALDKAMVRHASEEPGYRLALSDLRLPDCTGYVLRAIAPEVAGTVRQWRAAYEQELFALPLAEAVDKAALDVARWQGAGSHRVLWHRGAPVAMTGFNARLSDVVQVGAVYVPPALRGQGHARRAVGLHLAQAKAEGIDRAVLFAASDAAARAYVALGFQPSGHMGLVLFDVPQVVA